VVFLEARVGEVKRVTKETNVSVKINLDGSGVADSTSGIPFLDHMLDVSNFAFKLFFEDFNFNILLLYFELFLWRWIQTSIIGYWHGHQTLYGHWQSDT